MAKTLSPIIFMKYEKIYWKDISGISEKWMDLPELIKEAESVFNEECVSVGEVVYETEGYIIIAPTFDGNDKYHDASMIMKSVILKREKL